MISLRAEIRFGGRGTDRAGTAYRAEEDQLEPCAAVLAGRGGVAPARPVAVLVRHSAGENEPVWSFVGCEDVSARSDNSSGCHGASGRKGDAIEAAHFVSRFLRSAAVCSSPVAWSKNTNWPSSRFTVRPAGTGEWTFGRSARLKAILGHGTNFSVRGRPSWWTHAFYRLPLERSEGRSFRDRRSRGRAGKSDVRRSSPLWDAWERREVAEFKHMVVLTNHKK